MPIEKNDDVETQESTTQDAAETKETTGNDGEKLIIEMPREHSQEEADPEYGERVKKRINKEVAKRRAAEREIQQHQDNSRKLEDRIRELERITNYADFNSVTASEHNLATANARAQEMYRNARTTGNSEEELKAVQLLSSIAADAKALNLYKQQNYHRFNGFQSNQQPQQQQQQQPNYTRQQQKPRLAQEAQKWLTNNDWFDEHSPHHDSDARSTAIAISTDLENEGYDVNSPDHYRELNKRLREEMPSRPQTSSPRTTPRGSPVSAPTRGTGPGRRVKVSEFQRDYAARHNIPLERLAKEID